MTAWIQAPLTPAAVGRPECALPGCTEPAPAWGVPCPGCRSTFGSWLAETSRPAPTREELAASAEAVRAVYRARAAAAQPEPERKRNQTCWLCEEKRTCTDQPDGWECDTCRGVR